MIANQFDKSTSDADYQDTPETALEAEDITLTTATKYTKSKHYQGANYGRYVSLTFHTLRFSTHEFAEQWITTMSERQAQLSECF